MTPVLAMSAFGWVVIVAVWIALAFWPARVAGRKGHSFAGYFIFSLFFFPLAPDHGLHGPGSGDHRPRAKSTRQRVDTNAASRQRGRRAAAAA